MKPIATILIGLTFSINSASAGNPTPTVTVTNADSSASNVDLLQTNLDSSSYAGAAANGYTDETSLFNGTALVAAGYGGDSSTHVRPSFSDGSPFVTFNLDLGASPTGYEIDSITLFNGWSDGGRDNMGPYDVAYSLVGDSGFIDLVTGQSSGNFASFHGSNLINDIVPLATGVDAIRVTFTGWEAGFGGLSEIDVVGSALGGSEFAITSIARSGTTATLIFEGEPNTTYVCKSSTDLNGFPTTEVPTGGSLTTDGGGDGSVEVDATGTEKFYRLEDLPPPS